MRIPILAAAMMIALGAAGDPAWAAPAGAGRLLNYQSTDDYMRLCGVREPGADCKQAFVQANNWVRFNSDARLCTPDLKTGFGSREYAAAVDEEIGSLTVWLKDNPQAVSLDYVQSLGRGLIALYACK